MVIEMRAAIRWIAVVGLAAAGASCAQAMDMDEPTLDRKQGNSGNECHITGITPDCDTCVSDNCCGQYTDCRNDGACSAELDCCVYNTPQGCCTAPSNSLFFALLDCVNSRCSAQCPLASSSY